MTGSELREIAAKMLNFDFDDLADAGVLTRKADGTPSVGGSDWRRYNDDPLTFICKLPTERRDALAAMLS